MDRAKPYFPAPRAQDPPRESAGPAASPPYRLGTPPAAPSASDYAAALERLRRAPPALVAPRALQDAYIEELAAARGRRIRAAYLQMGGGFGLFAVGMVVTVASAGHAVLYGAMLVGVLTLFRGVVAWISALG